MTRKYLFETIYLGASKRKELLIVYNKKTTGETVKRQIRPFEIKGGYLWASCKEHNYIIHRFILNRIQSIKLTNASYRAQWPIKIRNKPRRSTSEY